MSGCDFSRADLTGAHFTKMLDTLGLELQRVINNHERWIESGGGRGAQGRSGRR